MRRRLGCKIGHSQEQWIARGCKKCGGEVHRQSYIDLARYDVLYVYKDDTSRGKRLCKPLRIPCASIYSSDILLVSGIIARTRNCALHAADLAVCFLVHRGTKIFFGSCMELWTVASDISAKEHIQCTCEYSSVFVALGSCIQLGAKCRRMHFKCDEGVSSDRGFYVRQYEHNS